MIAIKIKWQSFNVKLILLGYQIRTYWNPL